MGIVVNAQTGERYYQDAQGNIHKQEPGRPLGAGVLQPPEVGPLQAGLIAAGDTMSRAGNLLGIGQRNPDDAQIMRNLREQHPVATTIGGAAPEFAVPGGPFKGVAGWLANRGIDAAGSMLFGPEDMSMTERAVWGAGGGAAGDMATRLISNVAKFAKGLKGAPEAVSATHKKMAQQFQDAGGRLTPGMETGDKALKNLESGLETGLFTGSMTDDLIEHNTRLFNQKIARAAGLPEEIVGDLHRFDDEAMAAAQDIVGARFDDVASQIGRVEIDDELAGKLTRRMGREMKELLAEDGVVIPKEGGFAIDGEQAMILRSALRDVRDSAARTGKVPRMRNLSRRIDELDEAIERSAPAGLKEQYSAVRDQYRILKKALMISL